MKKALIIASCGLLAALIIGATTQAKPDTKNSPHQFFDRKCTEPTELAPAKPSCALRAHEERYADMFLREVKRKERFAYA